MPSWFPVVTGHSLERTCSDQGWMIDEDQPVILKNENSPFLHVDFDPHPLLLGNHHGECRADTCGWTVCFYCVRYSRWDRLDDMASF